MNTRKENIRARAAGGYITLPKMSKNKVAEVYYRRAMTAEIERMLESMFGAIKRAYTTIPVANASVSPAQRLFRLRKLMERLRKEYGDKLDKNTKKIINKYIQNAASDVYKMTQKQFSAIYADGAKLYINRRKYEPILKLISQRNAYLIDTTKAQIFTNVTNVVYDGVTTGQSWRMVEKDLRNQKQIAADRIKRIARDQTAKLNESLNEAAMRDAGVEFFEWMTANDERVSTGRGGHKQLDGKIYKWGDEAHYPEIDSYGHHGVPGQRINCRCSAVGVILQKDYQAHQTPDGDWVITKGRL